MKRLTWLILLGILVLSVPLAACSSSGAAKITVATDATWPPFEFVNEQTKAIEGFDIDIMNAIAAKEKLSIEFKNVAWDPLLAGMAQGTYDVAISSITITEDRKKDMLFSDPYFEAGQLVVSAPAPVVGRWDRLRLELWCALVDLSRERGPGTLRGESMRRRE